MSKYITFASFFFISIKFINLILVLVKVALFLVIFIHFNMLLIRLIVIHFIVLIILIHQLFFVRLLVTFLYRYITHANNLVQLMGFHFVIP